MRMGNPKQLGARRNHSFLDDSTAMEPASRPSTVWPSALSAVAPAEGKSGRVGRDTQLSETVEIDLHF